MRKYVIGGIVGFMLAFAVSAHAEVIDMIGKTVQGTFPLTINNQRMEYDVIVLDGTSYAPVRMLAEVTGYIVRFDSETGVKLVKKVTTSKETVLKSISSLNSSISTNEMMIEGNEEEITRLKNGPQTEEVKIDIQMAEKAIDRLKKGIIELNDQIAKLKQTLIEIEEQELELNPQPAPKTLP